MLKSFLLSALAAFAQPQILDYRSLRYATVVGQTSDFTCGPAALATLLTFYYGRPVSEAAFTERAAADMQARGRDIGGGLSLLSLRNALRGEGVAADGYRLDLAQLRDVMALGLPVVANVQYPQGHFYLVLAVEQDHVLLADPSWGVRSQPVANFLDAWNGVVLIPQPSEDEAQRARAETARQVARFRERQERLRTGG